MAGLWFRIFREDRTGSKETMLGVLLLQVMGELSIELPKRPHNSDYFKEKMLLMQAQENGVDLDEEQLLFLVGGQTKTFDDETMFMANLSSADPVYDEAGPSYDSDTLSEDNEDQVIHSDASSVPNDAVMIITNDIYEQDAPCVTSNNTVNASLTAELARYKDLAEMRMLIKDRNVKEESLQKELHSVKMQLNSTLNHNKLIREEVSTVAIGYKNLFYLSKAKKVQPALYNGHEIVKTNHAYALVYDSEDALEIAETIRKQMIKK
ncbi:hypothetical protein Tco_0606611 [Tanacetum coccineum]